MKQNQGLGQYIRDKGHIPYPYLIGCSSSYLVSPVVQHTMWAALHH